MNGRKNILVALAFSAIVAGCNDTELAAPEPIRPLLSVVVSPQAANQLQYAGSVEPRIQAELGFRLLGRVIKRQANVGDIVTKGQVIAMLDPLVLELAVRSAEAELSNAEAQLRNAVLSERRQYQLSQVDSASQAEYENALLVKESAQASLARAEANLDKAKEQLTYTQLHAEFDGVISEVSAEVGQVLSAGETAFVEARPDLRDVVIDVPEDDIAAISIGAPFDIFLQLEPSIRASGTVREIAPQSDETTRTHRVKISLLDPSSAFRLGTIVTASATIDAAEQLVLPKSALVQRGETSEVWVIDPKTSTVSARTVTVKGDIKGVRSMVITAGLQAGERVAVAGVHSLKEGQQVRIDVGGTL